MNLHIVSDIHLEFYPFELPDTGADAIILAGDIGLHTRGLEWAIQELGGRGKPIFYVIGNHEFYGAELHRLTADLKRQAQEARDAGIKVWVLDNDRVDLDGVRFLGCTLWTDYQLYGSGDKMAMAMNIANRAINDHRVIRCSPHDKFTPSQALALHQASVHWLKEQLDTPFAGKTVVITHHLPSELCVVPQFKGDALSPAFASNRDALVKKADLWVCAHTHSSLELRIGGSLLMCNPRGYVRRRPWGLEEENPDFDPGLVVGI